MGGDHGEGIGVEVEGLAARVRSYWAECPSFHQRCEDHPIEIASEGDRRGVDHLEE